MKLFQIIECVLWVIIIIILGNLLKAVKDHRSIRDAISWHALDIGSAIYFFIVIYLISCCH
jgi:hypothetical protein